ncbi:hypothetical protein [Chitinophaga barathri]|nr:hypothetical protein [Chitinophaga barathri]
MKQLSRSLSFILLVTSVLFIAACGKDGDTGPAGADGPAGAKGDKGDKGDPGDGGATIIYSDWMDMNYEPDTIHLANGQIDTLGFFADMEVPKLTKTMLATADVKVYINLNTAADPVITPLPYADESGIIIRFLAHEGTLAFYSNIDARTFMNGNGDKFQQYRYMIVPGNTAGRQAVNWKNYAEVKAYLGLKD